MLHALVHTSFFSPLGHNFIHCHPVLYIMYTIGCICRVARDNPLYVDPDAVVGAGDGAEAA